MEKLIEIEMSHNPNRPGPLLSAESLRSSNSKWNICRWILAAKSEEKQILKAFCHGAFMCFYKLYEFSCFTALCIKVVAFMITSGVHEVCGRCSKASWPCESPAKQYILCHWSDTGQLWGAVLSRNCESLTFLTVSQESYFSWCQADYYEGWGLHGRFILVESAVMDCLSEDKGLVAVREGYDRYRGDSQLQWWEKICERCWNQSLGDGIQYIDPCISQVYHLRSLAKSWKNPPDSEVAVNGSSLTWLLREVFTGLDLDVIFFPQQKLRDIWTSHSQMSFSERNPRWRWQCGSTYTLLSWAREASGEWLDWLDALTPKPSECRSQSHLFEVLLWWSWWRILQESRRIQQLPYCGEFYWGCESPRLGWFLFFFHSKVTQDHRVAGWARAMRAERISLKQAAERGGGGGGGGGDKDTRSLILELEKRLATAERCGDRGNQKATGDLPSLWV